MPSTASSSKVNGTAAAGKLVPCGCPDAAVGAAAVAADAAVAAAAAAGNADDALAAGSVPSGAAGSCWLAASAAEGPASMMSAAASADPCRSAAGHDCELDGASAVVRVEAIADCAAAACGAGAAAVAGGRDPTASAELLWHSGGDGRDTDAPAPAKAVVRAAVMRHLGAACAAAAEAMGGSKAALRGLMCCTMRSTVTGGTPLSHSTLTKWPCRMSKCRSPRPLGNRWPW